MRSHDTMNDAAAAHRATGIDDSVLFRVWGEFAEMPGLKLTLPQASRLFQLEASRCQRVLGVLVDTGQLVVRGNTFLRTPSA
jgi:hypothetical protein